jgi:hypothetical protein
VTAPIISVIDVAPKVASSVLMATDAPPQVTSPLATVTAPIISVIDVAPKVASSVLKATDAPPQVTSPLATVTAAMSTTTLTYLKVL